MPEAMCTGKKGQWGSRDQGSWSQKGSQEIPTTRVSRDEWALASLKAGEDMPGRGRCVSRNWETLTACLGSKLSPSPSSVGQPNNAFDAYPLVFKVLLSTFDFLSEAWAVYILMTVETALLPLPLHWLGTA